MNFSITKYGQPLNPELYNWDEENRTFSTNEYDLVLDFRNIDGVTFKTGSRCTFTTGSGCMFTTGSGCTFTTGSGCTFDTLSNCTFKTKKNCVVIRRDIFEVIKLEKEKNHIKLNRHEVKGFEEVKTIEELELERMNEGFKLKEEEFEI